MKEPARKLTARDIEGDIEGTDGVTPVADLGGYSVHRFR
jgi:hypothetical protein